MVLAQLMCLPGALDASGAPAADVYLPTVHASKGREWDNVQVLGDLAVLACGVHGRTVAWRSAAGASGDEYAVWYVALTRARKLLSVPPQFVQLLDRLQGTSGPACAWPPALVRAWASEQPGGAVVGDLPWGAGTQVRK